MPVLDSIHGPDDLKALRAEQLPALAEEIRTFLVDVRLQDRRAPRPQPRRGRADHRAAPGLRLAARHDRLRHRPPVLRPQAAHRPARLHQAARSRAGCPATRAAAESEHDVVENSHASTALSWADGIAKAHRLRGESDRHIVAVIGDGALTGGMAWEALNNIAVDKDLPLVIVVNDNERSYAPTIGGLADHLATLRTTRGYERFLDWGKCTLGRTPGRRRPMYEHAARGEEGPQGHRRPAGDVRGPRPEVPRPGRRPRRAGGRARAAPAPAPSAARSSCTSSPRRAAATHPPATTRPTSSTASA